MASNWGKLDHPNWFMNLVDHPQTTIEIGSDRIPVVASRPFGHVYEQLWDLVTRGNKQYLRY